MIIDVIPFLNEFDVLELRLKQLAGIVDMHVVFEFDWTFSGRPRSFSLFNAEPFRSLTSDTHLLKFISMNVGPMSGDALSRETAQRRAMANRIGVKPSDIILWCDADEIPNPAAIGQFDPAMGIARLVMSHHCETLDWQFVGPPWDNAKILTGEMFAKLREDKAAIADPIRYHYTEARIENAGWHIAYSGGSSSVIEKIRSTGHFDHPDSATLQEAVAAGRSVRDLHPAKFERFTGALPTPVELDREYWRQKGLIE